MKKKDELLNPNSCFNRALADEFVFVLLGRDVATPAAIRAWTKERILKGKNIAADKQIVEATLTANAIEAALRTPREKRRESARNLASALLLRHYSASSPNFEQYLRDYTATIFDTLSHLEESVPRPVTETAIENRVERVIILKPGINVDDYEKSKLCYVDRETAYFTTQSLADQWGDDWNDVPYEHNAGSPYTWRDGIELPRWNIFLVKFEGPFVTPDYGTNNSRYSVEAINGTKTGSSLVPWLRQEAGMALTGSPTEIWAGTTLSMFRDLIVKSGGRVWEEVS